MSDLSDNWNKTLHQGGPDRRLRVILFCLQIYVVAGGVLSLIGWAADIPRLTDWTLFGISIQPNAALAAVCAGSALISLALGFRRIAAGLGIFIALIGLTVFFEYRSGISLGIDTLLMFHRTWGSNGVLSPGRMGPNGALSWLLIGAALVFAVKPIGAASRIVAPILGLISASISSLSLIGYFYGVSSFFSIPTMSIIAVQAATFVFCASVGLVLAVPDRGPLRIFADDGPAGTMVRRVFPALLLVPIFLGYMQVWGANLYDSSFGSALRTILEIALFLLLLWRTSVAVHRQAQQRSESDAALRTGERRVIETFEQITDGFVTLDREWRFTFINTQAEVLLGETRGQLLGKKIWDVFPDFVGESAYRRLLRVAATRTSAEFEDYNATAGRWFAFKAYSIAGEGIAVYFDDITQRKRSEYDLRRSQEELEAELTDTKLLQRISQELISDEDNAALYEHILDAAIAIMHSDCATMQTMYPERGAKGALRLIADRGFSAQAAQFWEWVGPDSQSTSGVALRSGTRVLAPDVTSCDFMAGTEDRAMYLQSGIHSVQSTPLISRTGALVGMLSTHWRRPHEPSDRDLRLLDILARQAADLIEHKKAEEALREREASLNEAQRLAHIGSWQWNAVTDTYGVSNELYRVYGLSIGQAIPNFQDQDGVLYPHESWVRLDAALHESVRTGQEYELDLEALRNQERIWITTRGEAVRDESGRIVGLRGTVQDISERKAIETAREQALARERTARADAERAVRLKDDFLATVSHELRTPLNAILGWSHFLKKDISDPERAQHAAEVIERNGRLQSQLIADLLDMSRILSGKMRLDVRPVELALVIDAAMESISPAADAKGVRIHSVVNSLASPVIGDPDRLQQIMWNLLSNAVKFTPKGGSIETLVKKKNSHVEIRVTDTGEGISGDFLPHVFDRFRQADSSTSRSRGGLGIGLALVKQLTELHGGSIRAESGGLGKGAAFILELPVLAASEESLHVRQRRQSESNFTQSMSHPQLNGIKVLLVDDEPDSLGLVRRAFEENKSAIHTARSSDEALAILSNETFDLIVSDIGMPGHDGYEFITQVRARSIPTPAIALTAFARSEDRARSIASGYQFHVCKPVEIHELLKIASSLSYRKAAAAQPGSGTV